MDDQLRLLCVMAHPDDETLGTGGILAKYAAVGVETYLVTATRGERGWFGDPDDNPGLDELGRLRTAELQAAAATLGLKEVSFLDYIDGDLDQADPDEGIRKIVTHIRRVRPQVVVTFDPGGAYGHPDHIAICQFTTAALVAAADSSYRDLQNLPPHRVLKLYYMMATKEEAAIYEEAFGDLVMVIDGVERRVAAWESWAITTRVDTSEYWEQVWDAVFCHKTQLPGYDALKQLPLERQQELWAANSFYRALSLVNGGRKPETDLFEGVREYQKRELSK